MQSDAVNPLPAALVRRQVRPGSSRALRKQAMTMSLRLCSARVTANWWSVPSDYAELWAGSGGSFQDMAALGYRWRRMSRSGRVCSVHVPYGGDCAGEAASRCSSTGLHSAFQKVGDCEGPRSKCAYEGAHSIYFKVTKIKKNVTFQSRGGILFSFKRMLLSSFLIQTRRRKAGAKQAVSSKFRHR